MSDVFTGTLVIKADDEDTRECWENKVKEEVEEEEEEEPHATTRSLTEDDLDTIQEFLSRCQELASWEKNEALCYGCQINHPSQRRHPCLFQFEQIKLMYFDQILDSVFKPSLGKALHYLFSQISPEPFSQEKLLGAAETLKHYLKLEHHDLLGEEEKKKTEEQQQSGPRA